MSNRQTLSAPTVRPLDKGGFIPLYFQIQQALMEKIHAGELSEGDSLASEEELARIYQVSRMTARQALHGLKTKRLAPSAKRSCPTASSRGRSSKKTSCTCAASLRT